MDTHTWRNMAIVTALAVVVVICSLVFLGSQISGRLGGPCIDGDQPRPSFCSPHVPTGRPSEPAPVRADRVQGEAGT